MRLTRYRFGEFELDPASRELRRGGELLAVPLKSLECLSYLVAHRERAVGRDELISAVWGRADVSDTVITQTVRRARKVLDDAGNRQTVVRTVPGFGYRWVAAVEEVEVRPDAQGAASLPAPAPTPLDAEPIAGPVAAVPPATMSEPAPARTRSTRRAWLLAGAIALVAALGWGWWLHTSRGAADDARQAVAHDGVVMVLPVSIEPVDPEYSWVRLGAMEYAAGRLRGADLKVLPTEQTLHLSAALGAAGATTAAAPTRTQLQGVLKESGAHWLLVPQAQREQGRWRVRLLAVDPRADVQVEAQGDTPLQAMAVATDAWLRRIGHAAAAAGPTPLQERLQRVDAELDAGQLEAAREQIVAAPASERSDARLLVREGQLEYRAGRIDEAKALFERALTRAASPQDPTTRAKGLMGMGSVALRQGDPADAEGQYAQALAVLQPADGQKTAPSLLGNAYNGRGVARVQSGNLDGAVSDLGLARVAMQQDGDEVSAAMVGSNLGRIEAKRNHWPQAVQEYERAIVVFDRYQVRDYLAATLASKAGAQLALVQPRAALETMARTDALAGVIEDAALLDVLDSMRARVLIANGQLDAASAALKSRAGRAGKTDDPVAATLNLSLALARNDVKEAARLAANVPRSLAEGESETVTLAVQAAGNADVAKAWRSRLPSATALDERDIELADRFAGAVIQRRFGDKRAALAMADEAAAMANRDGSPDDRLRAGVLRALVLLDAGDLQAATSVLGELDAYVGQDYRVAWLAWATSRGRGEPAMERRALDNVRQLGGQRPLTAEPPL